MSIKMQPGGMFNSYKAKYNPETHSLLKLLMDEVKLTSSLRKQMHESMKRGDPLPMLPRRRPRPSFVDENLFDLKKNYYFSKRSQEQIMHSGAYDKERYRFLERTIDLEKEKERLANLMVYGKTKTKKKPPESLKKLKEKKAPVKEITPEERVRELMLEIEDRLEFLKEMEEMGYAKSYESAISQEIAAKVREMRQLDKNAAHQYSSLFVRPRKAVSSVEAALCHD